MSTLLDIVGGALTSIGQLGQGQSVNPEDGALGLRRTNLLLAKFSTQRLLLYWVNTRTYQLSANTADYTIGPGGGFVAVRPTFIEGAQINVPGTQIWLPLSVLDKPKWDAIRTKDSVALIPNDIWPEYTFPNLTFHVNPAPTGTPIIRLGCWEQLTQFATLFDTVNFPPGYEEFLEAALAIAMAPDYDQPISQAMVDRRADALASIQKINAQGMGGALGPDQLLASPNVGQPIGGAGAQPTPGA